MGISAQAAEDVTIPLVEFREIIKVYGKGQAQMKALAGVNLYVNSGEFVTVMGPSGSGKSTSMNIIGCLDSPTSGGYLFKGVEVGRLSRDQRALLRRQYLGFVFQGFNLLGRTSALENVEMPLLYRRTPSHERHTKAMEALRLVGLEGLEKHTPAELSGGQQQRVAIARAIVTKPHLLLADEPTGNLDTATGRDVMDLLTTLNTEIGITIVMVTHEAEMARYARRTINFRDGLVIQGNDNKGAA